MVPRPSTLCVLAVGLLACGDDASGEGGAPTTASVTAATTSGPATAATGAGGGPITADFQAGGARPVTVQVPESYEPGTPAPLLILLHGFTASGALQNAYFGFEPIAEARGMIYAYPDGTENPDGDRFWNATDACCDFYGQDPDDVAYLLGLVDEIAFKVDVDPKRIYFVGHSNGGFMSYRLACEAGDRIAVIVSLAGASFGDPMDCGATAPLTIVQVHGDLDDTVPYGGGAFSGGATIPSAAGSVGYFAALAGCDAMPADTMMPLDLEANLAGAETRVEAFGGCDAAYAAELWTIEGGGHVPALSPDWGPSVIDFLLAHPKP